MKTFLLFSCFGMYLITVFLVNNIFSLFCRINAEIIPFVKNIKSTRFNSANKSLVNSISVILKMMIRLEKFFIRNVPKIFHCQNVRCVCVAGFAGTNMFYVYATMGCILSVWNTKFIYRFKRKYGLYCALCIHVCWKRHITRTSIFVLSNRK